MPNKFSSVAVRPDTLNTKALHDEMQHRRTNGEDVTFKSFIAEAWGGDMTPEKFYRECGIDLNGMTVEKMLNTSEFNRWLFPEIFRDAIMRGLVYTPFHGNLVAVTQSIQGVGVTMPYVDLRDVPRSTFQLRDTNEAATITEAQVLVYREKQVTVKKKARGLKQTYESIAFTPIDLAAMYFQELGTQLGADLDKDLINVAINGDQADFSESAPVIGATTAGVLAYADIARAWIRFKRIGRTSSVILASEADALTILLMPQFLRTVVPNAQTPSGITINVSTPLPTSQDIFVHNSIPVGKLVMIDRDRAFAQLTAMPLLIESEKIVSRQVQGEYVSIMTGFANIFRDGRMILDYTTTIVTNPGPTVYII